MADLKNWIDGLSDAQRDEMRKALGAPPAAGVTESELDAAIEELEKGMAPADWGGAAEAAQTDVTGFLAELTSGLQKGYATIHGAQDVLAAGVVATANLVKGLTDEIVTMRGQMDEMAKALSLPMPRRSVQSDHDPIPTPGDVNAGATQGALVDRVFKALAAEKDDLHRRDELAGVVSDLELGRVIPAQRLADLGITLQ